MRSWTSIPLFALAAAASTGVAIAQCPAWSTAFHSNGVEGAVSALTVFDDGSGPALFAGGGFTLAGTIKAKSVVKWDGATWSRVGENMGSGVADLIGFDDGGGPALFATGTFVNADGNNVFGIAKWDGQTWSALGGGLNSAGQALAVFDDGSGAALYVGGSFTTAGGVASPGVARWNGSSWSSVGGGIALSVSALAVHDDGSGPALFAGGRQSGSSSALLKWNGSTWTAVGVFAPAGRGVNALAVHDDGSGDALFIGGDFTSVDGLTTNRVAKWNGSTWSALGVGLAGGVSSGPVHSLASFDAGSGAELYVGGDFATAGGLPVTGVARWNGSTWSDVAGGTNASVGAMVEFDAGGGSKLWMGGPFYRAGTSGARGLAAWDGAAWSVAEPSGQGMGIGFSTEYVSELASIDDGSGMALYAGGFIIRAGTTLVDGIARWNGTSWSALGANVGQVSSIVGFDDGGGTRVYAGGSGAALHGFGRWDGSSWTSVGGGVTGPGSNAGLVSSAVVFDDGSGPAIFAGGWFQLAGALAVSNIAKWNGSSWSALGSGVSGSGGVNALAVFDDGSGPALYVAGDFSIAGGIPAINIAKWDGANWSALGSGLSSRVHALVVHDDGSGAALYAGGVFPQAGGVTANGIAKWNGSTWSALGGGVHVASGELVLALASYDDGFGSALFASGRFPDIDGVSARSIARWDGASWSPLGDGLFDLALSRSLGVFQDGTPQGALFVGGEFAQAGGLPSSLIASWSDACACSGTSYCTSGTTSNGCVPTISGTGSASASASSGFTISVAGVEGQKQGHVFYGVNGPNGASWGASSHFLCVKAPTQRTGTQDSGGTAGACDGSIALDWNAYCATHPNALGVPFSAGQSVWAQLYFRDPAGPKTTALSNGLMFVVCP